MQGGQAFWEELLIFCEVWELEIDQGASTPAPVTEACLGVDSHRAAQVTGTRSQHKGGRDTGGIPCVQASGQSKIAAR